MFPGTGVKRRKVEEEDVVVRFLRQQGHSEKLVGNLLRKNKKTQKFTKDDICEAILLHAVSSKAYEMLRKNSILPLPSKSTLSRRVKHFQCAPGLQQEFFNFIRLKLSVADKLEKQCVILFDEMQISQTYEYCDRLKQSFPAHKKVQMVLLR
jgi:Transposase protein